MSSRTEDLIIALLNGEAISLNPQSRIEKYLKAIIDGSGVEGLPTPISRVDILLYQLAEKMSGGGAVVIDDTQTYMLVTTDGQEIPAVLVGEETLFTATENDIREGAVAATSKGVTVGTKVIPSYNTYEGIRVVTPGSQYKIDNIYDGYTKLQALVCAYNTSLSDSVSTEKVAINDKVYNVLSTDSISTVEQKDAEGAINLGITNESDSLKILRYFYYKEIY